MAMADRPKAELARRVLPAPLHRALRHVFAQGVSRCMLVGGTALSGYYAGHRRSNDLDLFAADGPAQRASVLAARSLTRIGARMKVHQSAEPFFSSTCSLGRLDFTVQVVLDENLFRIGAGLRAGDGVLVGDLETLLKLKAATLVSRCGEKDLYDLLWFFRRSPRLDLSGLVERGFEVDGGMTPEATLATLVGTRIRRSACGFSRTESAAEVFRRVSALKRNLAKGFERLARGRPAPLIGELIRKLRR